MKKQLLLLAVLFICSVSFSQSNSNASQNEFLKKFQGTWVRTTPGMVWFKVFISGTKFNVQASNAGMGKWGGLYSHSCDITEFGTTRSNSDGSKLPFFYTGCDQNYQVYYTGRDPIFKEVEIVLQSDFIQGRVTLRKVPSTYNPWN